MGIIKIFGGAAIGFLLGGPTGAYMGAMAGVVASQGESSNDGSTKNNRGDRENDTKQNADYREMKNEEHSSGSTQSESSHLAKEAVHFYDTFYDGGGDADCD